MADVEENEVMNSETEVEVIEKPFLSMNVLEIINEERNMHGLRHQDYQRYRRYCTKKIHNLRKFLKLTQGKKRYQKKEITVDIINNIKHLYVFLFSTERAWSYAMQLKSESIDEPRKHYHLMKRLRKAAFYANQLEDVCKNYEKIDEKTLLEVQAYAALMTGYKLFEEQDWQAALEKFAIARTIYEKLAAAGDPQQEALCHSTIDSIDPNIRYCAYNLKIKNTSNEDDIAALVEMKLKSSATGANFLDDKIEALLQKKVQEKASQFTSIEWRNHNIDIKNPKIAESILKANNAIEDLEKTKLAENESEIKTFNDSVDNKLDRFSNVLEAYHDGQRQAEKELLEDKLATDKVTSSKSEEKTNNLKALFSYISYQRLMYTLKRNLLLIKQIEVNNSHPTPENAKFCKPENIVKLYDIIQQVINEVKELPFIDTDVSLSALLSIKTWYYKACRCLSCANLYIDDSKIPESIALLSRANSYVSNSKLEIDTILRKITGNKALSTEISKEDIQELEEFKEKCEEVSEKIRKLRIEQKARYCLSNVEEGVASSTEELSKKEEKRQVLITHMDDYATDEFDKSDPRLIDFPPTFEPIPCKPLFFDIALNKMDYSMDRLHLRASGKTQEKKGWGLFSMWGKKK
ncbi:hypothetical protein BCR32DRAFT_231918 [Anaeromyces robustus]|uniref:Signal recognition particle subunit SRP68 n=1 Tax=Anaeromyces robustus TaxID=1754192 RepID=A0A1Y1X9W1_9FUNG|nr:hypothetical protein BCR32DRAFT_231918 [Anaeromyces robustus]|eukprot:ORX82519.1 hypothetical protein BCR32DRAFT_231918 [Anaeromyces robustus]